MKNHTEDLIRESNELSVKVQKAEAYLASASFEYDRLFILQVNAMQTYLAFLNARIRKAENDSIRILDVVKPGKVKR